MSTTTTPILLWTYTQGGKPLFAVGERPQGVEATLIQKENYEELIEANDQVGGFMIRMFGSEDEASHYVTKAEAYDGAKLQGDYTALPHDEVIAIMHGPDLAKGFHNAMRTGRFDLRGSWGMTSEEIRAVAADAIEPPAPTMGAA